MDNNQGSNDDVLQYITNEAQIDETCAKLIYKFILANKQWNQKKITEMNPQNFLNTFKSWVQNIVSWNENTDDEKNNCLKEVQHFHQNLKKLAKGMNHYIYYM